VLLVPIVVAGCTGLKIGTHDFDSDVFYRSLFQPDGFIIAGVWLTIWISVVSQLIGVVLGVLGALGKMARFLPFRIIANLYIWFFRGTPLLVQLMLVYYGIRITKLWDWPNLEIGGITIYGEVQAGIFALGVTEGAYMPAIVRAGILSIDPGQSEAGKALGMSYGQVMRRIVLPQAARVIVPPLGNEFNNMLKTTSLLVILGNVAELFVTFQRKNADQFLPFELFLACALWYLLLTTVWSVIQAWIERRLGKGVAGTGGGPSLRERLFGMKQPIEPSLVSGGR